MKFIARKGAPNIPLDLIEAQESGNLVFFCGAGISRAAGLPGFAGLVKNVYDRLSEKEKDSEAEAIEAGMKFARKFTGKPEMVAMNGSYHGKTFIESAPNVFQ